MYFFLFPFVCEAKGVNKVSKLYAKQLRLLEKERKQKQKAAWRQSAKCFCEAKHEGTFNAAKQAEREKHATKK